MCGKKEDYFRRDRLQNIIFDVFLSWGGDSRQRTIDSLKNVTEGGRGKNSDGRSEERIFPEAFSPWLDVTETGLSP